MGMTLVLFVLAVLNTAFGWWARATGDGSGVRLGLSLLWTVLAVWLGCSLGWRLHRGERVRLPASGSWWNL